MKFPLSIQFQKSILLQKTLTIALLSISILPGWPNSRLRHLYSIFILPFQSGFRSDHSIMTGLVRGSDYIRLNLKLNQVTIHLMFQTYTMH
jgi:hypothetical protein